MNYLILSSAWIFYLFLHSALASAKVKKKVVSYPLLHKNYRLIYSAISVLFLLPIAGYMLIGRGDYLYSTNWISDSISSIILLGGVYLFVKSFEFISGSEFLGLRPERHQKLIIKGLHKKVRHPIYLATILILIGLLMYMPTYSVLVSVGIIWLYLPVGIHFEETKLLKEFGDQYSKYKHDVPAILPRFFSKKT